MAHPLPRIPSADIGADLHLVDSRLRELYDAENGDVVPHDASLPQFNTRHDERTGDNDDTSTMNGTSTFPSGCTTPWEAQLEDTTTSGHVRPRLQSFGHSSMIQVRKETKKKWYKYPNQGVKVTTKYFYQEIDSSWTAVLIVACFFVSGLVDSVAFAVWSCFVAMQTGNTIFLAVRIANQPVTHHPLNYVKSLTSVACYCLGALAFNCLHRAPTGLSTPSAPLHRWTLLSSMAIQSALLVVTAILAQTHVVSGLPYQGGTFSSGTPNSPGDNYIDLLGIGLLAFEAAGQVCLSRVLLINELPTIVLSTLYHDLIGEALGICKCWRESKTWWDFVITQKKQIRRLASILSLFCGALVGGFMFRSSAGIAGALWVAAGVKIGICVAWCCWKKKLVTETVVTRERPGLQAKQ